MNSAYSQDTTSVDQLPKVGMASLMRLLSIARPYWRLLGAGAALTLVSTAVSLSLPLLARLTIDQVVASKDVAALDRMALIILGLVILSSLTGFVQYVLVSLAGNRIVMDTRLRLFDALQRLPVTFFDSRRSGDLTSHLSNDVSLLQASLTDDLVKVGGNVLTLIGGVVLAVILDWRLSIVVLTLLVLIMAFFVVFGRKLKVLTRAALDSLSEAMGSMTEGLANIRLVKAFGREDFESSRARSRLEKVFALTMRGSYWEGAMGTVAAGGFVAMLVGVVWFGGRGVLTGTLSTGSLLAFLLTITIISGPMAQLASLNTRLQRAIGAAERVFQLIDEPAEPADPADSVPFPSGPVDIEFRDVDFAYVSTSPVLQKLSLKVADGTVTALVGSSGAGKTTVASLLYRFYDIDAGTVRIGGVPISKIRRAALRENIGLVPQDTALFSGSILENIRYGRLDASDEEVRLAAEAANVTEFVDRFEKGMDTLIGERGVTLSGGQRQRVAIARVLLKNPKILILDEATSALDSRSEALVRQALDRATQGRTTLVIAHRLSTIQNADSIAVIERGCVVETGRHSELLARNGRYAELNRIGFEDEERLEEPVTV